MASEPIHFIITDEEWASHSSELAENCYVTQIIGYVICTRQNEAAEGILEAFRAVPNVVELDRDGLLEWREANPDFFPTEE